jgi:hypothetical protein
MAFGGLSAAILVAQAMAIALLRRRIASGSAPSIVCILLLLACACAATTLYVLPPGPEARLARESRAFSLGNSSICYLRYWFTTLPVVATISVLLQTIVRRNTRLGAITTRTMLRNTFFVVLVQLALLVALTSAQLTRATLVADATGIVMTRSCSFEPGLAGWLTLQLAFITCLVSSTLLQVVLTRSVTATGDHSHATTCLAVLAMGTIVLTPLELFYADSSSSLAVIRGIGQSLTALGMASTLSVPIFFELRSAAARSSVSPKGETKANLFVKTGALRAPAVP